MLGFNSHDDAARRQGLKDKVQLAAEGIDFNAPDAWDRLKAALSYLGSQVTFDDANQNVDLTGDRGGYVGIRPVNRQDPNSGKTLQWMFYNDSVLPQGGWQPGDYGHGSPYGDHMDRPTTPGAPAPRNSAGPVGSAPLNGSDPVNAPGNLAAALKRIAPWFADLIPEGNSTSLASSRERSDAAIRRALGQ
jgi:hypothetical protein